MTTAKKKDDLRKHNLQVQVNRGCKTSTLKKLAPDTSADASIPEDSDMTVKKSRPRHLPVSRLEITVMWKDHRKYLMGS